MVTLKIYNTLGEEVATLVHEMKEPGEYSIRWDPNGIPSGIYYYRLQAGSFTDIKKMVVIR